jgi:hypothetical protein
MELLSQEQAADMIRKSGGKIFSVTFNKRSTGTPRRLTGRVGVTQQVTGEGKAFNPRDHNLLTVYEFVGSGQDAKGRHSTIGRQWRHVAIEGITSLRMRGKTFQVQ